MKTWYMNLTAKQYWDSVKYGGVIFFLVVLVLFKYNYIPSVHYVFGAFLLVSFLRVLRLVTHPNEYPKNAVLFFLFRLVIWISLFWFFCYDYLSNYLN
jgi:hypothetical protein